MNGSRAQTIAVNALLVLLALFALFPLVWMLSVSFMTPGEASTLPPPLLPKSATLANYRELFDRAGMGRYLANSLLVASVITFLSLALNLAKEGIRVNGICPGPIDTPMLPKFFARAEDVDPAEMMAKYMSIIPLGRAGRPEEIAAAALFLASDESSFITGVPQPVDGGYLAG